MNKNGQGVLIKNKPLSLLVNLLLLAFLVVGYINSFAASPDDKTIHDIKNLKHHVFIVYTAKNKLHISIANALENDLLVTHPNLIVIRTNVKNNIVAINNKNDIIVSIGKENTSQVNKKYPDTNKLFLASNPEGLKISTKANKNNAVLYMAQPYCRQLGLIHTINKKWKTVSLLISENNNLNTQVLNKCANKFGLELFIVKVEVNSLLSRHIKDALNHSDVLLAFPDKNIYNSKTVKNILLTSYRYRKPVIAFSNNFVKAGALASIHSSPEQIAKSASHIIRSYFKNNQVFTKAVNHPQYFDVSINSQVYKALSLPIPNINKLKNRLLVIDSKTPEFSK